jgi:hypothetical protein
MVPAVGTSASKIVLTFRILGTCIALTPAPWIAGDWHWARCLCASTVQLFVVDFCNSFRFRIFFRVSDHTIAFAVTTFPKQSILFSKTPRLVR